MNESGSSTPRSGCRQRTSASVATMAPVQQVDLGQVVQQQCVAVDVALQMSLRCRCGNSCFSELSLATAIWLRPARLADRTASSARRSRSMPLSRPGMPAATPMLTVRAMVWSPMVSRSYTVFRIRSAKSSAAWVVIGWSGTTTNSSPPSRATMARLPAQAAQAVGESADVPVAGGVAERIVDRFQTVEIDVKHRDRAGLSRREPIRKVGKQRSTVAQPGQIVMVGEMAKPLFGRDAGLELSEQGRDGLEGVLRLRLPPTAATLDEPKHAGGHRAGDQRGGDHHRSAAATARRDGASETTVLVMAVDNHQILAVFA